MHDLEDVVRSGHRHFSQVLPSVAESAANNYVLADYHGILGEGVHFDRRGIDKK